MDRYQYADRLALSQLMHVSIRLRAVRVAGVPLALAVLGTLLSVSPAAADAPVVAASGGSAAVAAELGVFPWTALVAGGSMAESPTLRLPSTAPPIASTRCLTMERPSPVPPTSRERPASTR